MRDSANKIRVDTENRNVTPINNNLNNSVSAQNESSSLVKSDSKCYIFNCLEHPLLIIDVNIKPNEKKKIYVREGDTPEGLAESFSQENGK